MRMWFGRVDGFPVHRTREAARRAPPCTCHPPSHARLKIKDPTCCPEHTKLAHADVVHDLLVLPYDQRERCRQRARLASGEEVALFLVRGTVLRDGELLTGEGGPSARVVRVVAAPEPTYRVRCTDATMLARCAFHLGNRHTRTQVGQGWLRIRVDPVLKDMVEGLGAQVDTELAKFEPEAGAYGGGHGHHHGRPWRRPARAGAAAPENPSPVRSGRRMNAVHLLRLLQFASPALPIGGYSYSQGLEAAIEDGLVTDADSARAWMARCLDEVMACWDGPLLWRLLKAFGARDTAAIAEWGACFLASRDTAELRAETVQMGYSLTRLIAELGVADVAPPGTDVALPVAYACAVDALDIPHDDALLAMLFSWLENQVLVCVKSVPLGQVAGQRLLLSLHADVARAAARARTLPDAALSNWAPGLSMLSMRHEVQHGRLYRS